LPIYSTEPLRTSLAINGKKVNRLSYLSKNLGEASEDRLFMQFIPIELQPFDELLDRTFGFEWQQGKTKRDVAPLARIF
jgi:hypothetical protein